MQLIDIGCYQNKDSFQIFPLKAVIVQKGLEPSQRGFY